MKKIKLIHFQYPDKKSIHTKNHLYMVGLWNGKIFYYQNKKDVIHCLSEANNFLNNKVDEINIILTNVFTQYRQCWTYCDHKDTTDINTNFFTIDKNLQLCYERCHYVNGVFYVGSWLKQNLNLIKQILNILIEINKKNLNYVQVSWCESIKGQVSKMLNQIENYEANCKIDLL